MHLQDIEIVLTKLLKNISEHAAKKELEKTSPLRVSFSNIVASFHRISGHVYEEVDGESSDIENG